MNYTVFDVETANNQRDSICSIGVIRVEDNNIVFEKEILINPEVEFSYYNTRIHGITEADVANAPTFPEVWDKIKQYFVNTVLVAHNAKSMDLCALYRTLERYNLPAINNDYICTMELAKEIFKNDDSVECYKLNVLSKMYNIELMHHHDSLEDTRACLEILRKFQELYPDFVKAQPYFYLESEKRCECSSKSSLEGCYSDKTKEMQKLQELVTGIIADQIITDDEITELRLWLEEHEKLQGFYPFDKIFELVENIMLDGKMDELEEKELLRLLDAFINPQTEIKKIDYCGKSICLSGEFNFGSKKQVEEYLVEKGAMIAKSVTSNLDVLILGEAGSAAWKYGNYGSKYEKARQLNSKGKSIVILKENDALY